MDSRELRVRRRKGFRVFQSEHPGWEGHVVVLPSSPEECGVSYLHPANWVFERVWPGHRHVKSYLSEGKRVFVKPVGFTGSKDEIRTLNLFKEKGLLAENPLALFVDRNGKTLMISEDAGRSRSSKDQRHEWAERFYDAFPKFVGLFRNKHDALMDVDSKQSEQFVESDEKAVLVDSEAIADVLRRAGLLKGRPKRKKKK